MGTKVSVTTITGAYASVAELNANFTTLADAFDNFVSRNGTAPNTLTATLDANSQRIINVANATTNQEPATLLQLNNAILSGDPAVQLPLNLLGLCYADTTGTITNDAYLRWDATDDGVLILGGGATATPIRLLEPSGSGSNYIEFKAQAMAASLTFTLPAADGTTGQGLKTDGAGGLGWATFSTVTDHGALTGLGDDDHTQYLLASGTRALAGAWDMGNYALTNVNIDSGIITGITDLAVADGGTGVSSVTAYAVVCGGTTATAPLQAIAGVGTAGQVLTSNGAGALPTFQAAGGGGYSQGTEQATTSGTTITFTGLSGFKILHINFQDVSTNGTGILHVQLGNSGGFTVSGYAGGYGKITGGSTAANAAHTTGFAAGGTAAAATMSGNITIVQKDTTAGDFVASGVMTDTATGDTWFIAGSITVSGIDRFRLITTAADTFDGGSVNILYA